MVCNVFIIVKANYIDLSQNVLKTQQVPILCFIQTMKKKGLRLFLTNWLKFVQYNHPTDYFNWKDFKWEELVAYIYSEVVQQKKLKFYI